MGKQHRATQHPKRGEADSSPSEMRRRTTASCNFICFQNQWRKDSTTEKEAEGTTAQRRRKAAPHQRRKSNTAQKGRGMKAAPRRKRTDHHHTLPSIFTDLNSVTFYLIFLRVWEWCYFIPHPSGRGEGQREKRRVLLALLLFFWRLSSYRPFRVVLLGLLLLLMVLLSSHLWPVHRSSLWVRPLPSPSFWVGANSSPPPWGCLAFPSLLVGGAACFLHLCVVLCLLFL